MANQDIAKIKSEQTTNGKTLYIIFPTKLTICSSLLLQITAYHKIMFSTEVEGKNFKIYMNQKHVLIHKICAYINNQINL